MKKMPNGQINASFDLAGQKAAAFRERDDALMEDVLDMEEVRTRANKRKRKGKKKKKKKKKKKMKMKHRAKQRRTKVFEMHARFKR